MGRTSGGFPDGGDRTSRRTLLRYGFVFPATIAVAGVAGCHPADPAVRPTGSPSLAPTPTPTPTPTPPAGAGDAATAEALALAWCRSLAVRKDLAATVTANLRVAGQVHTRHLTALADPEPEIRRGGGPGPGASVDPSPRPGASVDPAPSASPTPSVTLPPVRPDKDPGKALSQLDKELRTITSGHLDRAASASGTLALLWASLAAGARQTAALARRSGSSPALPVESAEHSPYRPITDVAAATVLLTQLHAIVYGYPVALGRITGKSAEPYLTRLQSLRITRDELTEVLRDRGATVPVAEPDYETGRVADDTAALALIARMETALQPHLGNWVAASGASDRRTAASWLVESTDLAITAGAVPRWWPGWPDD